MILSTLALMTLAGAVQEPGAAPPPAACPKGLAGLECKAQRLNAMMADPAVQSGVQLFSLLTRKKAKAPAAPPPAAPVEAAAPTTEATDTETP